MSRSSPERSYAAVDLGAASGRVILGRVGPSRLDLVEVHRFPNQPVAAPDGLHWDLPRLYRQVLDGLAAAAAGGAEIASVGVDAWGVDYGLLDASGALLANPFSYRDGRTAGVAEQYPDFFPNNKAHRPQRSGSRREIWEIPEAPQVFKTQQLEMLIRRHEQLSEAHLDKAAFYRRMLAKVDSER